MKLHTSVSVPRDLEADIARIAALLPEDFPNMHKVVDDEAAETEERWKSWASGEPMPSGDVLHSRTGDYMRSITRRPVHRADGVFQEVFTDSEYHDALNDGTKAYDLKRILGSSMMVRRSKAGARFLIIPFRHAAGDTSSGGGPVGPAGYGAGQGAQSPGFAGNVVPERIVNWFKRQDDGGKSSVVGMTSRRSGQAHALEVPQAVYEWGATFGGGKEGPRNTKVTDKGPYTWKRGMFGGMTRFRGGAGYFTFRTMSENSPATSWMRPAVAALRVMEQLGEAVTAGEFAKKAAAAAFLDFASMRSLLGQGARRG